MPLPRPRRFQCRTSAALLGILLALLLPGLAFAAPSFVTNYVSFTDVNNNGLLDCGEPVHILVGVLTNDDSPAISGRVTMPAAGTLGLFYETGTASVDHFPIPTIGCTGRVVRGNDSGDTSAEVSFACPADTPGDNQSYALVLSYDAIYLNQTSSTFTATARFDLDDGQSLLRSHFEGFPATSCSGGPTELTVTKSASGPATPGSVLLYSITVTNTTGLDQGGIQLTDVVPDHTSFDLAGSSPGWSCPNPNPGAVCRLSVGTIPAGESVTRFFAVRIDATVPAPPVDLSNTACARNGPTLVLGCGSTSTPVHGMPLLELSKTLSSGTGTPGATLVYRLSVANNGNQDSGPVSLTETVPANTTFAPGASSAGWACTSGGAAGSTCTLLLPGVAAGQSAAADFAVTVATTLPAGTAVRRAAPARGARCRLEGGERGHGLGQQDGASVRPLPGQHQRCLRVALGLGRRHLDRLARRLSRLRAHPRLPPSRRLHRPGPGPQLPRCRHPGHLPHHRHGDPRPSRPRLRGRLPLRLLRLPHEHPDPLRADLRRHADPLPLRLGRRRRPGLALLETLDRMGLELEVLRSRVEELEAHLQALTLPAATPLSVKEFVKKHPSYTEGGLRWLLFHRRTNGLETAVIRHGRRLLIDERKFFEWEARHREVLKRL